MATDDVQGDAVFTVFDLHWAMSGFCTAPEKQESYADRAAGNVAAHIAFEVGPEEAPDDFGRGGVYGLVQFSKAFVKKRMVLLVRELQTRISFLSGFSERLMMSVES